MQLDVLRELERQSSPPWGYINGIADKLKTSSAAISRALAQLERSGHVSRRKDEHRTYRPSLTGYLLLRCAKTLDLYRGSKHR